MNLVSWALLHALAYFTHHDNHIRSASKKLSTLKNLEIFLNIFFEGYRS